MTVPQTTLVNDQHRFVRVEEGIQRFPEATCEINLKPNTQIQKEWLTWKAGNVLVPNSQDIQRDNTAVRHQNDRRHKVERHLTCNEEHRLLNNECYKRDRRGTGHAAYQGNVIFISCKFQLVLESVQPCISWTTTTLVLKVCLCVSIDDYTDVSCAKSNYERQSRMEAITYRGPGN